MRTRRKLFLCLLFLFAGIHEISTASGDGQNLESRFRDANRLYADGDYCEAAKEYRALAEEGVQDGRLFYNCANAYLKCGKTGRALQYYEKAGRLLPRDPDVRFNLEFVRKRLEHEDGSPGLIGRLLSRVIFFFSLEELIVIESVAVLLLAVLGTILIHLKPRRSLHRRSVGFLSWMAGITVILSLAFLVVQFAEQSNTEAIVIEEQVNARSGPGEDHVKVLSLPEGTRVWIDEERRGWYLIHLASGRGGWLPVDTLGII